MTKRVLPLLLLLLLPPLLLVACHINLIVALAFVLYTLLLDRCYHPPIVTEITDRTVMRMHHVLFHLAVVTVLQPDDRS